MPTSKPFAIATEGPTIDGRNISRDWIKQMADAYDPKVYTAVTNLEHYLSSLPDSVFGAYGKVVALSTRETEIMGEKKLQLMAVVDANDQIIALQQSGKKAFASMEVRDNFINKGIAYLTGLAFTDTPASVGTESMKFSAFAGGKDAVYSFAAEIALEFEATATTPPPDANAGENLFSKVKALLTGKGKNDDAKFADIGQAVEAIAESQKAALEQFADVATSSAALADKVQQIADAVTSIKTEFGALQAALNAEPADRSRPPAAGGTGAIQTDC